MIKTDKIRKPQPVLFTSSTTSGAALPAWVWRWWLLLYGLGAVRYLVNLCCLLPRMFSKALELLDHFQQNEIGISLWRSVVGITIALVAGLAAGLIAGSLNRYGMLNLSLRFVSHAANHLGRDGIILVWLWQPKCAIYHYRISRPANLCQCCYGHGKCKQTTWRIVWCVQARIVEKNPLFICSPSHWLCDLPALVSRLRWA